jgi:hypothetical protein
MVWLEMERWFGLRWRDGLVEMERWFCFGMKRWFCCEMERWFCSELERWFCFVDRILIAKK